MAYTTSVLPDGTHITIRTATPTDLPEWLRMHCRLWPDTVEAHEAELHAYFQRQDQNFTTIVAEAASRGLVGFIEVSIRAYAESCDSPNVGYLEGWYVEAEYRRRGIGRHLVQAAEQWARSRGSQEMASDCGLHNDTSWVAHLRLGYQETLRLIHFKKSLSAG